MGRLREAAEVVLVAVILALYARTFLVQAFRIPSESMMASLLPGDHVLVNKFVYRAAGPGGRAPAGLPGRGVRRGEVVVFRFPRDPSRAFVKRCVGLPGERVELAHGRLLVNGRSLDEAAYLFPPGESRPSEPDFGPLDVRPGEYFCLGDNRARSSDSRHWGTVPARYIEGRALLVLWSRVERPVRGGTDEREAWGTIPSLPESAAAAGGAIRWERSFTWVR